MQAVATRLSNLAARISPAPVPAPAPVKKHLLTPWVERDASGIWVGQAGMTTSRLYQPYAQHPTIFNAVNQTGRNLSQLKLEFFRGDSDEAMPPTDPFVMAFWRAVRAGGMTQRQFVAKYAQDMELTGDWFLTFDVTSRVSKRGQQFPAAFYRRPRNRMTPNIDPRTKTWDGSWKYLTPAGVTVTLDPEQVVHSFYPSPYDDIMGIAPLQAALMEADTDYAAQLWMKYLFDNDSSSGVVFARDKDAFADEANDKRFMEWWNNERRGVEKSHNAILPPPGVTVDELGTSPRDMDFEKLRIFTREQILGILGVPPPIAGIFADATLANITHAMRFFWYNKLYPMADDFENTVQSEILDRFNTGVRCAFKRENVQALIDDMASKIENAVKLWNMGVPFEQVNDRLDLGFDTSLWEGADVGFLPFSLRTVGDVLEPPEPPEPEAPPEAPPKDKPPEKNKAGLRVVHSEATRRRRWLAYMSQTDRAERDMLAAWRGFIDWAGEHAIADLHSTQQAIFLNLVKHDSNTILPDDEEVMTEAQRRLRPAQASAYRTGRKAAEADLGLDLNFTLLDRKVLKHNQERAMYIKSAALGEREAIRNRIDKGIQEGASVDKIEASLRQHMSEAKQGIARTVARTETMSAFSRARVDAFGEAGIEKHEWLSAHDDIVRESHQIDGEVVRMGTAFSNGLFYPMDPMGPPEETINCRCVALPVVE